MKQQTDQQTRSLRTCHNMPYPLWHESAVQMSIVWKNDADVVDEKPGILCPVCTMWHMAWVTHNVTHTHTRIYVLICNAIWEKLTCTHTHILSANSRLFRQCWVLHVPRTMYHEACNCQQCPNALHVQSIIWCWCTRLMADAPIVLALLTWNVHCCSMC